MRFLLVDRILALESGRRATAVKNVTMSEDFLAYHFPDRPIMPGMLIVEALVQLAEWLVREQSDFQRTGMAVAFDRLKFRRVVRPGDQLLLEVEAQSWGEEEVAFKGRAASKERPVASANFTLQVQPLEPYLDPAEARRMYRLLAAPDE